MTKPIWPKMPPAFVGLQLTGHKLLGLSLAALMYLICLSGTVSVFYTNYERWERPNNPEFMTYAPQAVALAAADTRERMLADKTRDLVLETDLYVTLPTKDLPRLSAGYGEAVFSYDQTGRYVGPGTHDLTHFITELHYYLHIPGVVGITIVGLIGVGLIGLTIGGLLSHPRLLKDAFLLRLNGTPRLSRTDIHNRLGVWAAPFHVMIALTGAVIALSQVLLFAVAMTFYNGDITKIYEPIFGSEADGAAAAGGKPLTGDHAMITALNELRAAYPRDVPTFIIVHEVGKPAERLEITALPEHRLIYGETYRFDADGHLKNNVGMKDGHIGQQVFASLYNLHFGAFGGFLVKVIYTLLGLGLCLICTTGMDIWLIKSAEKGKPHPQLHQMWTVFVWAVPIAMAVASSVFLAGLADPKIVFWGLVAVSALLSCLPARRLNLRSWSIAGRTLLGLSLIALPIVHIAVFKSFGPAALSLNIAFAAIGTGFLLWQLKPMKTI